MHLIVQALLALALKLLSSKALEQTLLMVAQKVADRTDTKMDNDFVDIIRKNLGE
jgi:hypothetical protein